MLKQVRRITAADKSQATQAYTTLSNPTTRKKYDTARNLRSHPRHCPPYPGSLAQDPRTGAMPSGGRNNLIFAAMCAAVFVPVVYLGHSVKMRLSHFQNIYRENQSQNPGSKHTPPQPATPADSG
eukprot:m.123252 g.123252  ORF g.123252 m.123252 type:complete len:125 (-) comp13453_c0_seq4:303-677(-)